MVTQIQNIQSEMGAECIRFGADPDAPELVATFGAYETEYAAIRRFVGVLHLPQRGIVRLTGADRQDFLHRLVTQDVKAMRGGASRRAFQLNQKGRIVADLFVHHGDEDTWLETDGVDIPALRELLESRLFGEDVRHEDFSPQREGFAVLGPAACALVERLRTDGTEAAEIAAGTHHVLTLAGTRCTVTRRDDCGVPGLRLFMPSEDAADVYEALLDAAGYERNAEPDAAFAERRRQSLRGRPVGWLAYNTARIEAGTPLFHVDFGPDSLPAETGLEDAAVSFAKGCYLGQEIVARMKNLGHPKRVLAGLRFDDERMPIDGAQVLEPRQDQPEQPTQQVVGGVTSAAVSPVCGNVAIALAVMKWGRHEPGRTVLVAAEGELVPATVQAPAFLPAAQR